MSTPHEPTDDAQQPATPGTPPHDAPTEAYPTGTPAAPPVPPAPGHAQAPQAPYGQPAYGQPAYGQPAYAAQPSGPDTRPKTLAWVSLGLAVAGVILSLIGFVPVPWVGIISVVIGGLLLLVAFVLSIVALASRKQGGKPFSIIALVVAVLGGGLWAIALFTSIALTAITSSGTETGADPAPSSSIAPSDEAEPEDEGESEAPAGEYDTDAFLAEARPAILEVFQEVEPSITEELVDSLFPDAALIAAGEGMLLAGDAGRTQLIDSLVEGGTFSEDAAGRFADAILDAAERHLQQ